MTDSPSVAFQLLLDGLIIFLLQYCENLEAQKVPRIEDWSMSRFELLAFIASCAESIRREQYFFRQLLK